MTKFIFDLADYRNIEGLFRGEAESPYLAPVFFEIDCLVPFFYNCKYNCSLFSETYGTIYYKKNGTIKDDRDFYISFGINKNKKVIMWLGDLEKLPEKEQKLLASFNIESDHDITSEFYDAQIHTKYANSIKEIEILLQKTKINEFFLNTFKIKIYKTDYKDFDNVLDSCRKYKKSYLIMKMISKYSLMNGIKN